MSQSLDCLNIVAPRIKEYVHPEESLSLEPHIISGIKRLWADPAVQDSYKHRHNFQLADAAQYYLDNVDRFNQSDFEPSHEVMLLLLLVYFTVYTTGHTHVKMEDHWDSRTSVQHDGAKISAY